MTSTPRSFASGAAFAAGKLYIFREDSALVVRAWPDPRAWRLGLEGPWRGARPVGLDLAAPDKLRPGSAWRRRCEARAFAPIPRDRRRAAARFGDRGWPLHNLFTRVPGALALAELCPALAVGLAFSHLLRAPVRKPQRSARALLRSPGPRMARDVAAWLGFEPSRAVTRVLRKIEPRCCDAGNIIIVRAALQDRQLRKVLLHADRLGKPALVLLGWAVDPGWRPGLDTAVVNAAVRLHDRLAWGVVGDILHLRPWWADVWPERPLPRLVSVPQIARLAARVNAGLDSPRYLRSLAENLGGFPTPPLPGGLMDGYRFEPLYSVDDLIAEGCAMEHCIGSRPYVGRCARGEGFGYRVEAVAPQLVGQPQNRATVWIDRGEGQRWELGGLQARGNAEPSFLLREVVKHWLGLQDFTNPVRVLAERTQQHDPTLALIPPPLRPRRLGRQPPRRPPPAQGHQLGLQFDVPF
jgi:hypothetical protein